MAAGETWIPDLTPQTRGSPGELYGASTHERPVSGGRTPASWRKRLDTTLWQRRAQRLPPWQWRGLRLARVLYVLVRDLVSGELTLRAMGLVYTTLVSLVPLLAVSFSVLKAFGVHNQLEPMLAAFLAPLGGRGDEITRQIVAFIDNVHVGVLGAAGLGLLIYTVVSVMQKIEESFNFIWHVSQPRGFGERFSRYLSVLLVGPLLVFSAMGITASVMHSSWVREVLAWQGVEQAAGAVASLLPYMLVVGAFTFLYAFIPNTAVRLWPAFAGGLVGGVLWQSAGWAFAAFIVSSTRYAAIYSGFAIVILFMIWLYLSWLIVLFGCSIAFYFQYPQYLLPLGGEPRLSNRMRERLALAVATEIARAYADGRQPPRCQDLAHRLGVPHHGIQAVLEALVQGGVLATASEGRYLPARDLARVSAHELVGIIRAAGEDRYANPDILAVAPSVQELLDRYETESARLLGSVSVASLAATEAGMPDRKPPKSRPST